MFDWKDKNNEMAKNLTLKTIEIANSRGKMGSPNLSDSLLFFYSVLLVLETGENNRAEL